MLTEKKQLALRNLPAVNTLLQLPEINYFTNKISLNFVTEIIANTLEIERDKIKFEENYIPLSQENLLHLIINKLERLTTPNFVNVINATGVVIHTNLGRSKLSRKAVEAIQLAANHYNNLEYRLNEGKRGSRYEHVEELLKTITGAEAALVVNNNAAAVVLVLNELGKNKEVIVSRGELIEIGGSFRVSEIMRHSGAKLIEVGTTNKTHSYDYENAITEHTALLMKVHHSNFKMIGFTKNVCRTKLAEIGKKYQLPVYEDLGSGVLYDLKKHNIGEEPTVQEVVKAGIDIISFSGDKLLGGPQAGMIVGKKKYIDRIKKNHLNRSLRIDKLTLAALEATLSHYLNEKEALEEIPTLNMLTISYDAIKERSLKLGEMLKEVLPKTANLNYLEGFSEVGGGSLPGVLLPTHLISLKFPNISTANFEQMMRLSPPHIIGRIENDQFLIDVRTIEENEFTLIKEKIRTIIQN